MAKNPTKIFEIQLKKLRNKKHDFIVKETKRIDKSCVITQIMQVLSVLLVSLTSFFNIVTRTEMKT